MNKIDLSHLPPDYQAVMSSWRKTPPQVLQALMHEGIQRAIHKGEQSMPPTVKRPTPSAPPAPAPAPKSTAAVKPAVKETPRHVALKAFTGPDGRERAYSAWMDFRARFGRYMSKPDPAAESFMKARGFDVRAIVAAATESTPTSGGYLVSPLNDAVIELRSRIGVSRQTAFVLPIAGESADVPLIQAAGGLTAYYPNEVAAITPSDLSIESIFLKVKKRAVLSYVSRELFDDSQIAFLDLFVRQAAYALAKKEDLEYIRGDATSAYGLELGLLHAIGAAGVVAAASGHDSFAEVDLTDWAAAMAALPDWAADGREAWITSAVGYVHMLQSVGGASQGFDDQGRPLFLGKPVFVTPAMPNTSGASAPLALYGNFESAAVIGVRQPVAIAMSEHAAFESDTLALRATARYDIVVTSPGDASTPGAYVLLQTSAT